MKKGDSPAGTIHGERRFTVERRRYSYAGIIPERRFIKDRRDADSLLRNGQLSSRRTSNKNGLTAANLGSGLV